MNVLSALYSLSLLTKRQNHQKLGTYSKKIVLAMSSSTSSASTSTLSKRLDGLDTPTVWEEFSPLSVKHESVNLGQGFPDWSPPAFVLEAMSTSINERHANQYTRSAAHLPLAEVLAEDYNEKLGREIDPLTMVATAVGCSNILYCAMQGLVNPGDEVLLLEPAFDIYIAQVRLAGGIPKFIPLRPSDDNTNANTKFKLDLTEFEKAITPRTKVLLFNTPHNPTGKMFSISELEALSEIIQKHPQLVVLSDEVYDRIVFDKVNSPHISIGSIDGMFERTLTLNSSGKTFSATGWKVGWAVGPPHLVRAIAAVQQWVNFCAATPNQDAIALSLRKAREPYENYDSYYDYLAAEYLRKRDLLVEAMECAGITPIVPLGGFFIMGDTSHIEVPQQYLEEVTPAMPTNPMPRDWAMSRWMTKEVGVTAIPPSAFYDDDHHLAKDILRFAYCKSDDLLIEAKARFQKYFGNENKKAKIENGDK